MSFGSASSAVTTKVSPPALATKILGLGEAQCPPNTAPDSDVCVHLVPNATEGPLLTSQSNAHRDRSGNWTTYDQIPRLPARPSDYDLYRYPIPPGLPQGHYVVSGYDLDRPDPLQRRGRRLRHV